MGNIFYSSLFFCRECTLEMKRLKTKADIGKRIIIIMITNIIIIIDR